MTDFAANIASLEAALARGVLTVEANGERVTYRSVDDLLKAIAYSRAALAASAGSTTTTTLAAYDGS